MNRKLILVVLVIEVLIVITLVRLPTQGATIANTDAVSGETFEVVSDLTIGESELKLPLGIVLITTDASEIEVQAEVARTPREWASGLSNRESLDENSGMLFITNDNREMIFWMKDTLIPLDIIFISKEFVIVDVQTAEPCTANPCKEYTSKESVEYALEVNAGFADKNGITVGDSAIF